MDWAAKSNQLVTCAAVSTLIVSVLYVQLVSGAFEHSVFALNILCLRMGGNL